MFTRVIIALKSACARAEARDACRRLLAGDDQLLRDAGVTRADISHELRRR